MKFVYEYRTSDNVRHDGVIAAANREAAFAALKAKGIRPGVVAEAPGFFNKLFGKGKRWIAIVVLCFSLVGVGVYVYIDALRMAPIEDRMESSVRRQIIGDAAVIEKGVRTGWSDVFTLEGDRFLASFAVPGVPAAIRYTTEEKLKEALSSTSTASLMNPASTAGSFEARQVVAIVAGMKREINDLVASGWTLREVGTALAKRQDREIGYYDRATNEVENARASGMSFQELLDFWEQKNNELRNLGIRLVPMPE